MLQSAQAITIAIFYAIMFLFIAYVSLRNLPMGMAFKSLSMFLIMIVLLIYDTDCLVTGGCNVYSWIRTVLYLIVVVIMLNIISLTMSLSTMAKNTAVEASTVTSQVVASPTVAIVPAPTVLAAITDPTANTANTANTTVPLTSVATPSTVAPMTQVVQVAGTPQTTTEKFASWEGFSCNDDDYTNMF
jgi:hypothetical protein